MKKGYFILILLLYCFIEADAQLPYRFNKKTKEVDNIKINYSKSYSGYSSKFKIYEISSKDTLCKLELIYDPIEKIITIDQIDIVEVNPNEYNSKEKPGKKIYFNEGKTPCIVKNYKINDKNIRKTDTCQILFTIPDSTMQEIILNQITSIDNSYIYFISDLSPGYLSQHKTNVIKYLEEKEKRRNDSIYKINKQNMDIEFKAILNKDIKNEKNYIKKDSKRLIKYLDSIKTDSINYYKKNCLKQLPKNINNQIDEILKKYLRLRGDTCPDKEGRYTLNIRKDINTPLECDFPPNIFQLPPCWFKFNQGNINNAIREINFKDKKIVITKDDPYLELKKLHNDRWRKVLDYEIGKDYLDTVTKFKTMLDSIEKAMSKYKDSINVLTKYCYTFSYSLITENYIYRLKNGNIFENFEEVRDVDVSKSLSNEKFNGNYKIKKLKSRFQNVDLDPIVNEKRIFSLKKHYGFNIGTFIYNPNRQIPSSYFTNGNLIYLNIFYIDHYLGVFGGYMSNNRVFRNYTEEGIYFSPFEEIFYFKLGIADIMCRNSKDANGNAISMPDGPGFLVGGSLVFKVIHFEGGFNTALKYAYIMGGLNLPIREKNMYKSNQHEPHLN